MNSNKETLNTDSTSAIETSASSKEVKNDLNAPVVNPYDNMSLLFTYAELNGKIFVDKEDHAHLFLDDKELTKDIIAKETFLYNKEFWSYKDYSNNVHLFHKDVELTKNIKTLGVFAHPQTGQWLYANEKNKILPF